ncbi:hypothetical protein KUCAC02_012244, partial [Chaenocephalus aceratus]
PSIYPPVNVRRETAAVWDEGSLVSSVPSHSAVFHSSTAPPPPAATPQLLSRRQAQTCPVSGHTEERDAIAGRPDEWVARHAMTKTNVTAPVPQKRGRCSTTKGRSCDADHLPFLVKSPLAEPKAFGERQRSTEG